MTRAEGEAQRCGSKTKCTGLSNDSDRAQELLANTNLVCGKSLSTCREIVPSSATLKPKVEVAGYSGLARLSYVHSIDLCGIPCLGRSGVARFAAEDFPAS